MIRRGILILVVLCLAAGFSMYILDIKLQEESVCIEEGVATMDDDATAVDEQKGNAQVSASDVPELSQEGLDAGHAVNDGWRMVWHDDFNGSYLDMETWTEVDRRDNYNNELQYYTPANSYIKDGFLYLTAKRETKDGKAYTSAMVQTMYKLSFRYGRIQARIKVPLQEGTFPAFWLLTYESNNEIDIMEMIGNEPTLFYGVVHYTQDGDWKKELDRYVSESPDQFHTYTLEWEPDELRWYIDDELFFRSDRGVPQEEMYIIFTLAVGGDWPGTPPDDAAFPCSMIIDYVRLYQHQ